MPYDLDAVLPALLFWTGGLLRIPAARHNRGARALCLSMVSFALGLTVNIPTVYLQVDRVTSVPNLADLIEHVFGIVGVTLLLSVLRDLLGDTRERRRWWRLSLAGAALAASVALFFAAPLPVEATDFTDHYGDLPQVAAYWGVTVGYFGVCLAELGELILRYGQRTSRPALRVGFRIVGAGVILGVVYSLNKVVALVAAQMGPVGPVERASAAIDPVILTAGAVTLGVGLLIPVVASRARVLWEPVAAYWDLQTLRPLWQDLTHATPHVVLADPPTLREDLMAFGNLRLRRYRRLIEIRDAALTLRPYADEAMLEAAGIAARGLTGERYEATVEACWLRAARAAHLAGRIPVAAASEHLLTGREHVAAELRFLRRVSRAWRRSPRVANFCPYREPRSTRLAQPRRGTT